MEYRSEIVKEWFELRLYLNQSNQKSNEKSEIKLGINNFASGKIKAEFICFLNMKKSSFIVLSQKNDELVWDWPFPVRFPHLVMFCTNQLNASKDQSEEYQIDSIAKQLSSLGILQK